jgi:hypothetical protein
MRSVVFAKVQRVETLRRETPCDCRGVEFDTTSPTMTNISTGGLGLPAVSVEQFSATSDKSTQRGRMTPNSAIAEGGGTGPNGHRYKNGAARRRETKRVGDWEGEREGRQRGATCTPLTTGRCGHKRNKRSVTKDSTDINRPPPDNSVNVEATA